VIIALLTLLAAGIVKGAIGSGVPVIVVPVLTMLYDVKLASALRMPSLRLLRFQQTPHHFFRFN
jgi:uncharacterized membrane protein YfcA